MLKNTLTLRDQQTARQLRQPQGSATLMIIVIYNIKERLAWSG